MDNNTRGASAQGQHQQPANDSSEGIRAGANRAASMWQRTTLLQRFGSISLLLTVLLGLVAGLLLRGVRRDRTIAVTVPDH